MIRILVDRPTKKDIEDGIKELNKLRGKSIDGMAEMGKPRKETLQEGVNRLKEDVYSEIIGLNKMTIKNEGRLNRQGRDIFILWNKANKVIKENNKLVFVVRELLRESGLKVKVEKNGEVRLEERGRGHKERLKNKMMENFFKEVERAEHRVVPIEINERTLGRLAQMTLRDINEIK